MIRVTKANPCPVCEKTDWCLFSEDGQAAICSRVSEGSKKRAGDAGWLHILEPGKNRLEAVRRRPRQRAAAKPTPAIPFEKLSKQYQDRISDRQLRWLGASLGITPESLTRLNVGFDGKAFTFPMKDENGNVIGIRRRYGDGNKRALTGSCNGLFIPTGLSKDKPLFITEGVTDCAAALDLGFEAIGRPNCDSKVPMTVAFARGRKIVIICDNDLPGRDGAKKLAQELIKHCPEVKIITPPVIGMDLRQWKQKGFTGENIKYGF